MELPEILAGPILRRTEATRVCVWIATKRKMRVEGIVYDTRKQDKVQIGRGTMTSLSFGHYLFVTLVQITPVSIDDQNTPPSPFPKGVLLAYDLLLTPIHTTTNKPMEGYGVALTEHPEFQDDIGISYGSYAMPTFFIPQDGSFNILHGSCRKPHGKGADALATADRLIEEAVNRLDKRPSALLLTGDQIYADDVDNGLISVIANLGPSLLGVIEKIPLPGGGEIPITSLTSPNGIRGVLVQDIFSADNRHDRTKSSAKNQLLGFGDFASMYLLTWNVALWPDKILNSDDAIEDMRSVLPNIRRALANIPTYMIMDDHEITDDWNITFEWEQRVKASQLGRRILANGLAAYWVFQAWGNQPDEKTFSETFINTLVGYLGTEKKASADAYEAALIWPTNPKQWSFVTPTNPPVFFMDSRTRREKSDLGEKQPSELMNHDAIQDLVFEISNRKDKDKLLIIVAQTPIFGIPSLEFVIETEGAKDPPESVYKYDDETWHSNRTGFYNMLRSLHSIAPAGGGYIVLSGDVHYSFVTKATVTINKNTVPFIQFTSSALKNDTRIMEGLVASLEDTGFFNAALQWISTSSQTGGSLNKMIEIFSDGLITNRPMRPDNGSYLYRKPNLGQLLLPPNGNPIFNLYQANSTKPIGQFTVQLDTLP